MYFQYGSHVHSANEVNLLSLVKRRIESERGETALTRWTMQLEGVLVASSQAAIKSAIAALEAAYSVDGRDAGLYHDDGTPSPHFLDSSASLGGTRVSELSFDQSQAAEYATQRTYRITLEADFAAAGASLLAWQESLVITGAGGPRTALVEVLAGPPQKQMLRRQTAQRATQQGKAVGMFAYPFLPPPLWPQSERSDLRVIETGTPKIRAGEAFEFPIAWTYRFEAASGLVGMPARR